MLVKLVRFIVFQHYNDIDIYSGRMNYDKFCLNIAMVVSGVLGRVAGYGHAMAALTQPTQVVCVDE